MLANSRQEYILSELKKNGSVTVNDISAALSVSAETVRRDFILLETHGKLKRVFGGAVLSEGFFHFESFEKRLDTNSDLKKEVALTVCDMIDEGDSIAIDAGSTSTVVAETLKEHFHDLTVVTYSLSAFNILHEKFNVIMLGGSYVPEDDCFVGALTEKYLRDFHVNKALVFPGAVAENGDVECFELKFGGLHEIMKSIADKCLVLADSDKFFRHALLKILPAEKDFIYVTDHKIKKEVVEAFSEQGLTIVTGEKCDD